jgi:competence ComEA-like helix-hairpin-helix protein
VIRAPSPFRLLLAAWLLLAAAALLALCAQRRPPVAGPQVARPATPDAPAAAGLLWGGRLDLNVATADDLTALPGIGPVRAARIVAARAARGGRFARVDDLLDVPGIGRATLARLREHVTIGPPTR